MSAASAVALLICMFAFAWYGGAEVPAGALPSSKRVYTEDAWHGLTNLRWVMLAGILVSLIGALMYIRRRVRRRPPPSAAMTALLGTLISVLLIYRVLIDLPSPAQVSDQKLGALLGLISALGITLGGWQALTERRTWSHRPRPTPTTDRMRRLAR